MFLFSALLILLGSIGPDALDVIPSVQAIVDDWDADSVTIYVREPGNVREVKCGANIANCIRIYASDIRTGSVVEGVAGGVKYYLSVSRSEIIERRMTAGASQKRVWTAQDGVIAHGEWFDNKETWTWTP